jgi:hypothetical protein
LVVKALLRFADGTERICTGRVLGGEPVPWKDPQDMKEHIAKINIKHRVEVLKIIEL